MSFTQTQFFMANQPTPLYPPRKKGLIAGQIKRNQWLSQALTQYGWLFLGRSFIWGEALRKKSSVSIPESSWRRDGRVGGKFFWQVHVEKNRRQKWCISKVREDSFDNEKNTTKQWLFCPKVLIRINRIERKHVFVIKPKRFVLVILEPDEPCT